MNLASRIGHWSATRPRAALAAWLAFVGVALGGGLLVGTTYIERGYAGVGSSGKALRTLKREFPQPAGEQVLVQPRAPHSALTVRSPEMQATLREVVRAVRAQPVVTNVRSPLDAELPGFASRDGRSALVAFDIRGDAQDARRKVAPVLAAVARVQAAHPHLRVGEFGDASGGRALQKRFHDDYRRVETLSLPITLGILVATFGALVAAGLPIMLALTSVAGTIGLVAFVSRLQPVDDSVGSLVFLIGMAVGVDYSLFYIRRVREERAAGRPALEALGTASATAGRAVLVSGVTVMTAMAGMWFTNDPIFRSFSIGTIIVVGIAMAGSVTALPATLALLGDRVNRGRVPLLHRFTHAGRGHPRAWSWVVDRVLARPLISGGIAAAVLITMAIPAFGLQTGVPGAQGLPRDLPIVHTYDRIRQAFPGGADPATVVVSAPDVRAPAVLAGIAELRRRALAAPDMRGPVEVRLAPSGRTAVIDVPLAGKGTDGVSQRALRHLRSGLIPDTVGRVPGVRVVGIAGMTALSKDFNDLLSARLPIVFAFVLGLAFLLLLVTFRSVVLPLKAMALNLLSVGAAYGALVWIFQEGHLRKLLDFEPTGYIASWLPLFLFVILFGLSMDYHVLILSRVREAHDHGMPTGEAVGHGIKATAGVVTSAAFVMVGVFSVSASLSMLELREMGVGLALAVLLDATLVRAVLLPAGMKLLGDANWYLPRWLEWLPQLRHGEPPAAVPEPAAASPSPATAVAR